MIRPGDRVAPNRLLTGVWFADKPVNGGRMTNYILVAGLTSERFLCIAKLKDVPTSSEVLTILVTTCTGSSLIYSYAEQWRKA